MTSGRANGKLSLSARGYKFPVLSLCPLSNLLLVPPFDDPNKKPKGKGHFQRSPYLSQGRERVENDLEGQKEKSHHEAILMVLICTLKYF